MFVLKLSGIQNIYLLLGDIEGASKVLQTMKKMGHSVNENIFNSLIMGHSQNGDLGRAQGIVKVSLSHAL